MPSCWVLSPYVQTNSKRRPYVATLLDPGLPNGELADVEKWNEDLQIWESKREPMFYEYPHTSTDGGGVALSFVWGIDLTTIENDPQCTILVRMSDDPKKPGKEPDNSQSLINKYVGQGEPEEKTALNAAVLSQTGRIPNDGDPIGTKLEALGKALDPGFLLSNRIRPRKKRLDLAKKKRPNVIKNP